MAAPLLQVRFEGFDDLRQRIEALPDRIAAQVFRKALRSAGNKAATQLRKGTPKVSGDARKAIKVKVNAKRGTAWVRVYYKGRPHFYLRLREGLLKTSRQPARPFFAAATRRTLKRAENDIATALRRAVERAEAA